MSDDLLYKYRSFNDYGLRLLIDREVYFASPEELNDPLDGQMSIVGAAKELIDSETDPVAKRMLVELAGILIPVGDSESCDTSLFEAFDASTNNSSILSFSKAPCDPLMWAHYGDAHRGFCVGFFENSLLMSVKDGIEEGGGIIVPSAVSYRQCSSLLSLVQEFVADFSSATTNNESRSIFGLLSPEKINALIKAKFTEKDVRWGYEREIRYILNRPQRLASFNPSDVGQIIFGLKSSKENIRTVRNILRGPDWEHIDFLQVRHRTNSFEFELVEQSKS